MPRTVDTYLHLPRRRYFSALEWHGVAIGSIGLLLFWLAAVRDSQATAYTSGMLVTYLMFAGGHAVLHENRLSFNLSTSIRMGKMSASMLRPFPFLISVTTQAW